MTNRSAHGVPLLVAVNPARDQGPCTVCGVPWAKHGTAPTCASHDYAPAGVTALDRSREMERAMQAVDRTYDPDYLADGVRGPSS